jgi:type 1 glutamine amidotransferase
MHAKDELWHGLRGPAEELTILASAFSPRTEAREPMLWTVGFGAGRVFVTVLGHVWAGGETTAVECVGFQHTLARGCQWAATGTVDLPVPQNFPKEGAVSIS